MKASSVDWVVVADEEGFSGNGLGAWSTRGLNQGDLIGEGWFWDGDDDCELMSSRSCWSKSALSQKQSGLFWGDFLRAKDNPDMKLDIIWLVLGWLRAKDDPNMNCFPYVEENYEAIEEELGPGPIRQVTIQTQKEKK